MFCRYCGKQIPDDSEFCPGCGKPLGESKKANETIKSNVFTENAAPVFDDENYAYYKNKANSIASYSLQNITKVLCYIALGVFLFFNIKMAPMYGWAKFFCYLITAAIAIGIVVLFNKKVLTGESKKLYTAFLLFSIAVIIFSIGLRIVYESKVDYVKKQIPSSGDILITLSEETEYYNSTGTGSIRNPSTNIKIGDKWYDSGDVIPITLNKNYFLRVGAGGSGSGGYTDGTLTITKSSLANGNYTLSKNVYISSGPASMAEVTITFARHCTFWEVVFY